MPDLKALGAWVPLLEKELHAPYFEELQKKVADAYAHTAVFPPEAGRIPRFFPHAAGTGAGRDPWAGPVS